jgi:hypothetical protein
MTVNKLTFGIIALLCALGVCSRSNNRKTDRETVSQAPAKYDELTLLAGRWTCVHKSGMYGLIGKEGEERTMQLNKSGNTCDPRIVAEKSISI